MYRRTRNQPAMSTMIHHCGTHRGRGERESGDSWRVGFRRRRRLCPDRIRASAKRTTDGLSSRITRTLLSDQNFRNTHPHPHTHTISGRQRSQETPRSVYAFQIVCDRWRALNTRRKCETAKRREKHTFYYLGVLVVWWRTRAFTSTHTRPRIDDLNRNQLKPDEKKTHAHTHIRSNTRPQSTGLNACCCPHSGTNTNGTRAYLLKCVSRANWVGKILCHPKRAQRPRRIRCALRSRSYRM